MAGVGALLGGDAAHVLVGLLRLRLELRQLRVQLGALRLLVRGDPLFEVGQLDSGQLLGHPAPRLVAHQDAVALGGAGGPSGESASSVRQRHVRALRRHIVDAPYGLDRDARGRPARRAPPLPWRGPR